MALTQRFFLLLLSFTLVFCDTTSLEAQQFSFDNSYNTPTAETGMAMYYADYLHGKPTAYGEIYDQKGFTASHMTYPLGTMLKVTNLENNKSVIVRVNDKANFDYGVIIDLSKAAAAQLEMLRSGKARVRIEPVGRSIDNAIASTNTPNSYSSASYTNRSNTYDTFNSRSPYSSTDASTASNQDRSSTYNNNFSSNFGDTGLSNTKNNLTNTQVYGSVYDRTPAIQQPTNQPYNNQASSRQYNSYQQTNSAPQSYNDFSERGVSRINTSPYTNDAPTPNLYRYTETSSGLEMPNQLTGYTIQVACYGNTDNANRQVKALRQNGFSDVYTKQVQSREGQILNKVVLGNFPNRESAERYLETLKTQHYMDGYIIQL